MMLGRSREGAWIEIQRFYRVMPNNQGRSREGAWIEIKKLNEREEDIERVAPVRERGLKCQ